MYKVMSEAQPQPQVINLNDQNSIQILMQYIEIAQKSGTFLLQEADRLHAAGRARVGRCLQQQDAGRRQGRTYYEPTKCLGRCQTRCAEGCRAVLDAWFPFRSERSLRAVPALFLGHLELLEEQIGREEPTRAFVTTRFSREDGGGQWRL